MIQKELQLQSQKNLRQGSVRILFLKQKSLSKRTTVYFGADITFTYGFS